MRTRRPLSLKILFWFVLNLGLVAAAVGLFFNAQFHFNLAWAFAASGGVNRLEAARRLVVGELNATAPDDWHEVVQRYSAAYRVPFSLLDEQGRYLVGASVRLPPEVQKSLTTLGQGSEPTGTLVRTYSPTQNWLLTAGLVENPEVGQPLRVVLLAHPASLTGGGLMFDLRPWAWLALGTAALSFFLWFPFVRGITRALALMAQATGRIADGRFDVRVPVQRRDELGVLAESINQMATRLDNQTQGQKRFLSDVAHELCSPLARLRLALGVLEQRAEPGQLPYVQSAGEKAEQIATLVNELLLFSRASYGPSALQLQSVNLRSLVHAALRAEECVLTPEQVAVPEGLRVIADPALLERALGNLIRNALRYGGGAGGLHLTATPEEAGVELRLADAGPGVPEADLARIFDPFYRVDPSRTRGTGGTGLGLAIVKSSVESCGGAVLARNRPGGGLEVCVRLVEG